MTLLSKPYEITFSLIGSYLSQLYMNPVRTKSISNGIISGLANYVSQRMAGGKLINHDSFWAFVIFGLLFGGTIPHYFFEKLNRFLAANSSSPLLQLFIIERLIFMPIYSFFQLYILSRFEGKSHEQSFDHAALKFPSVVEGNFKFLSLLQYINIFFVPPVFREFFSNFIWFLWVVYLSQKRQGKH